MTLAAGTRLGPYDIDSPLGAGGMGEVYKGHDTRLDRSVAIKIQPEHLSSNPEFKLRFEREARAISALNHPHICVLHDAGSERRTPTGSVITSAWARCVSSLPRRLMAMSSTSPRRQPMRLTVVEVRTSTLS